MSTDPDIQPSEPPAEAEPVALTDHQRGALASAHRRLTRDLAAAGRSREALQLLLYSIAGEDATYDPESGDVYVPSAVDE